MIKKEDFVKAYKNEKLTLKEIAEKFGFSVSTVKNYASIFKLKRGKGNRVGRPRKVQV